MFLTNLNYGFNKLVKKNNVFLAMCESQPKMILSSHKNYPSKL